ncbi:hypothetical protein BDN67DRAFT_992769 [Paxillus ammoniavirescens]|nr:hypothetical protein BDN67DRAFT_992769 [Paxillus ammoniavirescens]
MSPSDTLCPEEILTGPNNYEIWKVRISAKLHAENFFGVVSGTDIRPVPSTLVTTSDIQEWQECDEKAHGIIQLCISDSLLMKTHSMKLQIAWDGTSAVSDHISTLCTIESHLAGMRFSVNDKVLSFILLNSLPKTSEWEMFKSSVVNTMEESNLTFDAIETRITAEDS